MKENLEQTLLKLKNNTNKDNMMQVFGKIVK